MTSLPTLDCHAHIDSSKTADELITTGAVLAVTLSLQEAEKVITQEYPKIVWGMGCHPRILTAQKVFDGELFSELIKKATIVGEIGLDSDSRVPLEIQLTNFRQILDILPTTHRLVSIHSYQATELVLKELQEQPINYPVSG